MTGAEAVVATLEAYGVEVIFGVPGDTSLPLYDALRAAAPAIRHVMARDERSASFMADAYARLSHRPGICECPSGAGALYSVPGVAEADASSVPVILLTSDTALAGEGKKTITELDVAGLFGSITQWSTLVKLSAKIPETLRRAFRVATTGRPGAVQLALPQEVMAGAVPGGAEAIFAEPECRTYPAYRTRGSRKSLEALVENLVAAERPALVAGGGVNHSQAGEVLREVAEWLAAPVATTISGQGALPDAHPLAMGVIGDNGFHPHALRAVEEADAVLYVGCKMGSVSTIKWSFPSPRPDRKVLQIDLDPELLSNNYRAAHGVAGDARLVLEDLLVLLRGREGRRTASAWLEDLNRDRARFWEEAAGALRSEAVPLKPQRVVAALNRRLSPPTVVVADAGTPTPYITRFLRLGGGGSRFLIPRAYGGLGYAIPALVGAHFARPEARLVGLFGDGSLGMSAGELETLARLRLPAVLVHFNNACFGWIKALQGLHSGGRFFSVDFTPGDPVRVAEGFGLRGLRAETPAELEAALDDAFADPGPVFVDVVTEPEVAELPPVLSWHRAARGRG